uniref:Uncharacterized protein n=1 Tax=Glossina palpalis gambiensis TaxID=67801 RepID=A0A1B0C7C5_9MUSC
MPVKKPSSLLINMSTHMSSLILNHLIYFSLELICYFSIHFIDLVPLVNPC